FSDPRVDVYLACAGIPPADLVRRCDERGLRAVGDLPDLPPDDDRVRRIMSGCQLVVAVPPVPEAVVRIAGKLGIPVHGDIPPGGKVAAGRMPPYAFFIGLLERDFSDAAVAMRA